MLGFCCGSMTFDDGPPPVAILPRPPFARSSEMRLPDYLRTSTFRLAVSFAVMFAISVLLLFAFIYWQTALYETVRIDRFLVSDAALIARQPTQEVYRAVSLRNLGDLHRITYAALFDGEGRLLVGNLAAVPPELSLDGRAHALEWL